MHICIGTLGRQTLSKEHIKSESFFSWITLCSIRFTTMGTFIFVLFFCFVPLKLSLFYQLGDVKLTFHEKQDKVSLLPKPSQIQDFKNVSFQLSNMCDILCLILHQIYQFPSLACGTFHSFPVHSDLSCG